MDSLIVGRDAKPIQLLSQKTLFLRCRVSKHSEPVKSWSTQSALVTFGTFACVVLPANVNTAPYAFLGNLHHGPRRVPFLYVDPNEELVDTNVEQIALSE
jgi:hypothetical protein